MSRRRARRGKPWIVQFFDERSSGWRAVEFVEVVQPETGIMSKKLNQATRMNLEFGFATSKKLQEMFPDGTFRLLNVWTKEIIPTTAL